MRLRLLLLVVLLQALAGIYYAYSYSVAQEQADLYLEIIQLYIRKGEA